ncbi:hypothetical protein AV530_011991 [Patagioenas fasciata monilis]|uniref:Uncharacterized protein n=1 Tax=Patagioenas fasciata monilis TaxID=372326 RepID=A0A1V4JUK1_PATFA|nr:hypothetical protein AV530_011991 [Patagioenas fasciata monilis]
MLEGIIIVHSPLRRITMKESNWNLPGACYPQSEIKYTCLEINSWNHWNFITHSLSLDGFCNDFVDFLVIKKKALVCLCFSRRPFAMKSTCVMTAMFPKVGEVRSNLSHLLSTNVWQTMQPIDRHCSWFRSVSR